MPAVNHDTKEVSFKLVYCGVPMGGKATSLNYIHSRIDGSQRGDLVSPATSSDRTLFFDFLPVQTTVIEGYRTRFMLHTAPGQVNYNATHRLVLRGVDGIVFVADSQGSRMEENAAAWRVMEKNLEDNGTPVSGLPVVLQFNKRDLPSAARLEYMNHTLNSGPRRFPSFETSAVKGTNIFATLNALAQEVLQRVSRAAEGPPSVSPHKASA